METEASKLVEIFFEFSGVRNNIDINQIDIFRSKEKNPNPG